MGDMRMEGKGGGGRYDYDGAPLLPSSPTHGAAIRLLRRAQEIGRSGAQGGNNIFASVIQRLESAYVVRFVLAVGLALVGGG